MGMKLRKKVLRVADIRKLVVKADACLEGIKWLDKINPRMHAKTLWNNYEHPAHLYYHNFVDWFLFDCLFYCYGVITLDEANLAHRKTPKEIRESIDWSWLETKTNKALAQIDSPHS